MKGNPFNDGSRFFTTAGLDMKYGVSSSLTLDATFNPDFGQVEVDPAVVNLTQFETFFEERRPFFTEGAQVFGNFGKSGASAYVNFFQPDPTLFYSRRIGRVPQGRAVGAYTDVANATTILGAAKLVGRTRRGWTVGALEAVTAREYARISDTLVTTKQPVEPPSNYAVLRLQRELGRRAAIGFLGTSVIRNSSDAALDATLVRRASMFGTDGHFFLDASRQWVVHGGIAGSWVQGSTTSIARVQRAEQRYYQRPDAPHVQFDPTKTSLSGWMGKVNLNRNSGNLTVNTGLWGMSPGLEVNDAGYSTQTDRAGGHAMVQYRKLTPSGWTRERYVWVSKWWTWNYGNESQGDGWQASASAQFRNFWRSTALFTYAKRVWDDKLTRGGPTVIRPGNRGIQLSTVTDPRKSLVFSTGLWYTARDYDASSAALDVQAAWRPFPALTLSTGPSIKHNVVVGAVPRDHPGPARDAHVRRALRVRRARPDRVLDGDAGEPRHLPPNVAAGLPAAARLGRRLRGGQGAVRAAHLRLHPVRRGQRQHAGLDARAPAHRPGRRRAGTVLLDREAGLRPAVLAAERRLPVGVPAGILVLLRLDPAAPRPAADGRLRVRPRRLARLHGPRGRRGVGQDQLLVWTASVTRAGFGIQDSGFGQTTLTPDS